MSRLPTLARGCWLAAGAISLWAALACTRPLPPPDPAAALRTRLRLTLPAVRRGDPCSDRQAAQTAAIGCGPVPPFVVREVIERQSETLEECVRPLDATRAPVKIVVAWTITDKGRVVDAKAGEDPGDEAAARCLVAQLGQLTFPAPLGGGTAEVRFPFIFEVRPRARYR
jgi:hypothetical protein